MITQETQRIKISEIEAGKMAAFKNKDSVYDKMKEELTFTINNATGDNFRLIHDDKEVVIIVDGTKGATTSTLNTIEEFETRQKLLDRIEELGLEYTPPEEDEVSA